MYKSFIILSVLAVFVLSRPEDEKYTSNYDNLNVEEILNNERLLENYLKCILDLGPCTPEGQELKDHIGDALQTGCTKCTDKQKENVRKVFKFLTEKKKESWAELKKKYDPEGKYQEKYKDLIEKENLSV